jgi:HK97 family phage major capsid protein
VDVLNLLATMFAEQFQKTEDYYYLLGSGSGQPMGLLTQTTGMTSLAIAGASTAWPDIFRLKHSLRSQYRIEKSSCVFMTNNATIELLATLTDDQNRPVFLDRGAEGMGGPNVPPQTVGFMAGHAVLENPYTPGPSAETLNNATLSSVATTASVIFSNLERGYAVFKGPTMEVKTSDVAYDAFTTDGLYTRAIDFIDGKPAIQEATAILTGVK